MFLPAPRWLYRWQLSREIAALKRPRPSGQAARQQGTTRYHIAQSNWITVSAGGGALLLYLVAQLGAPWSEIAVVLAILGFGLLAYAQLLLFIWSNKANTVLRHGNFADVHLLLQNRLKELESLS